MQLVNYFPCVLIVIVSLLVLYPIQSVLTASNDIRKGLHSGHPFPRESFYTPRNVYRQRHPSKQTYEGTKPTSLQRIIHGPEPHVYGPVVRRLDYNIPPNRLQMNDYEFLRRDSRGKILSSRASKRIDRDEREDDLMERFDQFSNAAFVALKVTARLLDLYKTISFFIQ